MAKKKSETTTDEVKIDRRKKSDRRDKDRREQQTPVASERRGSDRRKVQRRRQIDPTTCERDYTNEEIEFMRAMDDYKRANGRMFPTCSEILEVVRSLGYERAAADNHIVNEAPDTSVAEPDPALTTDRTVPSAVALAPASNGGAN